VLSLKSLVESQSFYRPRADRCRNHDMNMRDNSTPKSTLLPALVAVIVLCLAGAAVLDLLAHDASAHRGARRPSIADPPAHALRGAKRAARGSDCIRRSGQERRPHKRTARRADGRQDPGCVRNKLTDAASKVGEARKAVETIQHRESGGAGTCSETALGTGRPCQCGRSAKARGHEPLLGAI